MMTGCVLGSKFYFWREQEFCLHHCSVQTGVWYSPSILSNGHLNQALFLQCELTSTGVVSGFDSGGSEEFHHLDMMACSPFSGLDAIITQKMNFSVLPLLHFGAVVCQVARSKGV
jgi:hypothetical protein